MPQPLSHQQLIQEIDKWVGVETGRSVGQPLWKPTTDGRVRLTAPTKSHSHRLLVLIGPGSAVQLFVELYDAAGMPHSARPAGAFDLAEVDGVAVLERYVRAACRDPEVAYRGHRQ